MNYLYFLYFLIPFGVGIAIIPFLRQFSQETGKFSDIAEGDDLKIHKKPISLLGGLAMVLSILAGFSLVSERKILSKIAVISVGLLVIFLMGLWDDWKWKHISERKPFVKFAILLTIPLFISAIFYFAGITFNFFPIGIASVALSFIYIFIVINSVNYQDGIDGLAGGLVFISLAGFALLGVLSGSNLALTISLIVAGSILSFLIFNFPPAKIFMGDSGAYFLGFVLAVLAILFSKPWDIYSVLAPIFIIGLPIFDGVFTNIRRLVAGKSIFLGDRSHFYDNLLQKGFSTKKTLAICYSLQTTLVALGIIIYIYL